MNKETEELILLGVGAYILLRVLSGSSVTNAAKLTASTDSTYANDAASVLNTAINDFSD